MTIGRPRILTVVPRTGQARSVIAKALVDLARDDESVRQQRRAALDAVRRELDDVSQCLQAALHDWSVEVRAELRKYNADEPRVPRGHPEGGQWTLDWNAGAAGDAGAVQLAGDPYYPPLPPGYDPGTWTQHQWPNGKYYLQDGEGNKYLAHPEGNGHWRHWDKSDGDGKDLGRVPSNALKPWPGQKRLKEDQSDSDPNGDAPPWTPSPFVPVVPVDPIPFPDFPVVSPIFVPG